MPSSPLLIENFKLNDDSNEASEASAWNFFYKYAIYYQRAKFMMLHNWDTLSDLYQVCTTLALRPA